MVVLLFLLLLFDGDVVDDGGEVDFSFNDVNTGSGGSGGNNWTNCWSSILMGCCWGVGGLVDVGVFVGLAFGRLFVLVFVLF